MTPEFPYDLAQVPHHSAIEELVNILCVKTGQTDRGFFRTVMAYFLGKIAGTMNATVDTGALRGEIPINIYAIGMATSGFGKGYSVGLIEELERSFRKNLLENTWPRVSERNLMAIAEEQVLKNDSDLGTEMDRLLVLMNKIGPYLFTMDSGTVPAVKNMRHKLTYSGLGAINVQIDEIGSNLTGNIEILTALLELYDQGRIKEKLILNSNDKLRIEDRDGKTPTNMLIFGTPSKVFDGGTTEDEFFSLLETGYARRCLFGFGIAADKEVRLTKEQRYEAQTQPANDAAFEKWKNRFEQFADEDFYRFKVTVPKDVSIELLGYEDWCEDRLRTFPEHDEVRKAEMKHRYFKALKLAGAFAFVDQCHSMTLDHLLSAIKLVEESGECFTKMLTREKPYVKLAKFLAGTPSTMTHADLDLALPFYKGGKTKRDEMMNLAMAWGYSNHVIIKKTYDHGIEFFEGETLSETDLNALEISHSFDWTRDYSNDTLSFAHLRQLATMADERGQPLNWINHRLKHGDIDPETGAGRGHRSDENILPGFNMIVIDVDKGVSLEHAQNLLKEFKFMTYTTKRHRTDGCGDRFRIVFPMKHRLELSQADYRDFMNSFMAWLPFESDEGANQRARKWLSNPEAEVFVNTEGTLIDVLPFIPKTSLNEQHKARSQKLGNLDALERWFAERIGGEGSGRNNMMHKYAFALKDGGLSLIDAMNAVRDFDRKLPAPLGDELETTVFRSLAKAYEEEGLN